MFKYAISKTTEPVYFIFLIFFRFWPLSWNNIVLWIHVQKWHWFEKVGLFPSFLTYKYPFTFGQAEINCLPPAGIGGSWQHWCGSEVGQGDVNVHIGYSVKDAACHCVPLRSCVMGHLSKGRQGQSQLEIVAERGYDNTLTVFNI